MFNSIIIIKLFYSVIFLFITTLSQDMVIAHYFNFIYICTFEFYYLYVCTFMAIGNTSLFCSILWTILCNGLEFLIKPSLSDEIFKIYKFLPI